MIRIALLFVLVVGCAVDAEPPQRYTCTIVYRCEGDANLSAALALPCALDRDDALERATTAGMQAAKERCGTAWRFVRPSCEVWQPAEACEPDEVQP